ncbi:MAG TPA: glycosyltransferase family 4 protein [Longimicrobium sp.]|nr:glycosyltransferase family 4 protein [Longimicrobium sp.]
MNLAFLSATAEPGGAERALLDLLASLRAAEPAWALRLVSGAEGPLAEEARSLGVAVDVVPLPSALASIGDAGMVGGAAGAVGMLARLGAAAPGAWGWIGRARRVLAAFAPHVVHTNGFKMHLLGARVRPRGAALVWHVHDYVTPRRVMGRLMAAASSRCDAGVAVSRSVAADLRAACGPRLPVHTLYNAVDLARFSPGGPSLALHDLAGLPPEAPGTVRVGLVATMGRWKGHEIFLDAVARLPRDLPVRAYVVGGGIYRTAGSEVSPEALRRRAAGLGIGDRVGFTGFVRDTPAVYRSLDVVVHASTQPEPFGLVIAEAMACGRAVVASAAGGAAEIVDPERDALAVPPGDAGALAEAIRRLATDRDLRERLGGAARASAEARFDRARLAAEIVPLYRALAGGRR